MMDHTSQGDLFGILLALVCFCLVQMPGTCAENSLQLNPPCTVVLQPPPKVTSDPLNVADHYVPRIKPDNPSEVVKAGGDVSLNCTAEGNPEPEVRWSFQNHIKATGRRQTVLTISKAWLAHTGEYTCTATNDLGKDTRTVSLTVESDCPIKIQPDKLVVEFETSASANCSTTIAHKGMGWEASQGAVDMKTDVQFITWRVENLTHFDIQPICFINTNTKQCELGLPVTVYKRPDRVSISTVNHTGPMIEGREYELQCDVQNVAPVHLLTVNWYKGQHLVKRESFSDKTPFPANKTTTLQISPRRDDDGVQYRCEAEQNLGPEGPQPPPKVTSDPLNITVYFGPELSICQNPSTGVVHLNEGASLAGYVIVTGKPFPNFYWEREGLIIDPATPLNRNSNGEYKIIFNKNNTRSLKVEVIYGPEISCKQHFIVQENTNFTPNCTVKGFPQITENWYKDADSTSLEFPQIMSRKAAGNYTLIASNSYFNVSHVIQIEVWYPPSEISELLDENVTFGKDVALKCASNGNPRPSYRWIYHQTSNVRIVDEDGVSLLHIKQASGENIGTYTCIVTNDVGTKKKTVRVDVQGAKAPCPLFIERLPVEVAYGDSETLTCLSSVSNARLSWKYEDKVLNESTLVINFTFFNDVLRWNRKASCLGHFVGLDDCQKDVNVTFYKSPDKVSISTLRHAEPMIEGKNYTLQCEVQNVAPVQLLTVNWYKGQRFVKNDTIFETKDLKIITESTFNTTLTISPSRNDNKEQYRCETVLKLGPQSTRNVKSEPLNITVHYKPAITEKLQRWFPVFHGYPVVLICTASGYPEPSIAWIFNNNRFEGGNLTVRDNSGEYICIANNSVGNDTRVVQLVQKEDYLPLIAGFVALVVVIISVIFISIYSIYYKNTKMGRYTVEGAKPKAQNGNVAQNGKDGTIPMKKIMV
ncbi:hypothetical protein AMELA_G00246540 [Ameiurus melas]|uniref:Ig-like domain-containing protein n=1 Tax=Ameiurus melas TaxID=219545 RepID=A0A7J5ZVD6_AMEME|nr:hypothetical protein AMELA_G00246540 [Ameiurus melas]